MYKISIIIPIYNAERTIRRAIQSVINQTIGFKNLELILIDDNSTDASKKIITEFSKKYENIIPIYLETNHGYPGYGRNIGIEKATSKYIMFMDNDDEYEIDICEKLYKFITNESVDLVSCDYTDINEDSLHVYRGGKNLKENYETIRYTKDIFYFPNTLIWNKIFKKSIILKNNIKFVTDMDNEDSLFCIEYFLNSNSLIYFKNYHGYIHYITGNNLSLSSYKYTLGIIKSYYNIYELINKYKQDCNYNRIFDSRIRVTIERSIIMNNGNYNLIKKIIEELYKFEKYSEIKLPQINSIILNLLNKLIFNNHLLISSIIITTLNKIAKREITKKIYHKII